MGERIRKCRLDKGWTQQELADMVGIAKGGRQRVCAWEKGSRSPRRATVIKMAEIFGVTAGWLAYGD